MRIKNYNSPFFALAIIVLVSIACGITTSSDETQISTVASQPEPNQDVEAPVISTKTLAQVRFKIISKESNEPEEGWITYRLVLSVENTSPKSIYFSVNNSDTSRHPGSYDPLLDTVVMLPDSSWVTTDEGQNYPIEVTSDQMVYILPPQAVVSGMETSETFGIQVTFKVPELLHPSTLLISPGISYEGGEPVLMEIETKSFLLLPFQSTFQSSGLPTRFSATENIDAEVEFNYGQMDYGSLANPEDTNLFLNLDFKLKNMDITGDQPVGFTTFLVSNWGTVYYPSFTCDFIPDTIGPGQTKSIPLCFKLFYGEALMKEFFLLSIVGENVDEVYGFQFPELVNCNQSELPEELGGVRIFSEEMISVPNTITRSVKGVSGNEGGFSRFTFKGKAGEQINVSIEPADYQGAGEPIWAVLLADPAGNLVLEYGTLFERALFTSFTEPIFCDGEYAIYVYSAKNFSNDPFEHEFTLKISN